MFFLCIGWSIEVEKESKSETVFMLSGSVVAPTTLARNEIKSEL